MTSVATTLSTDSGHSVHRSTPRAPTPIGQTLPETTSPPVSSTGALQVYSTPQPITLHPNDLHRLSEALVRSTLQPLQMHMEQAISQTLSQIHWVTAGLHYGFSLGLEREQQRTTATHRQLTEEAQEKRELQDRVASLERRLAILQAMGPESADAQVVITELENVVNSGVEVERVEQQKEQVAQSEQPTTPTIDTPSSGQLQLQLLSALKQIEELKAEKEVSQRHVKMLENERRVRVGFAILNNYSLCAVLHLWYA